MTVEGYLSGGAANTSKAASLGGARSTAGGGLMVFASPNNLFAAIPANDTVLGKVYYRCFYIRNDDGVETVKAASFFLQSGPDNPERTKMEWALGTSAINGTEQTIANETTAPTGVTWVQVQNQPPAVPNIGDLAPSAYKAIWCKLTLFANASSNKRNDAAVFIVRGKTAVAGAPTPVPDPGGGGGGTTPPPTPTNFKIVACGDWDARDMTKKVVAGMEAENAQVCVDTADHAYNASQSAWLSVLKSLKAKMIATVGNHDDTNTVRNQFGLAAIPYSIDKENVHFLVLNTEASMGSGSNQRTFVKADLKAARENPNIDWIIVSCHKPFYTTGEGNVHGPNENGQTTAFGADFDTYKVDLVLNGHNHNMERTYPVTFNSSSVTNPNIAQSGAGPYTKGNGTVFCVIGTGGHDSGGSLYQLSPDSFDAFTDDNHNGYVLIELSGATNNVMTVTYKDENGDELHKFVIQ
jgi:predicted phosphodiesterase